MPTQQTLRQNKNTHKQLDKHTHLTHTYITYTNHKKRSLNINSSPTIHKHPPKTHHAPKRLPSIITNTHSKYLLQNIQLIRGSLLTTEKRSSMCIFRGSTPYVSFSFLKSGENDG